MLQLHGVCIDLELLIIVEYCKTDLKQSILEGKTQTGKKLDKLKILEYLH